MKIIWLPHAIVAIAISGLAAAASAQYIWIDEKGVKQFSDMPPPPSVPQRRILKGPASGQRQAAQTVPDPAADDSAAANTASAKSKAPMTMAEKNAEFQKRRAEQAEKEKKDAEQAKLAAEKKKSCERTRSYGRALESGERIVHADKNGERAYLTEEQRMQEIRDVQRVLNDCK
jgi:hypothetical protein